MKLQSKRDWTALEGHISKNGDIGVTKEVIELIKEIEAEYKQLHNKGDIVTLRSSHATSALLDWHAMALLVKLNRQNIISDLYLPLTIEKVENGELTIKSKSIFLDDDFMLEEALKHPRTFNKNFISFKMNNWPLFDDLSKRARNKLGINEDPSKPSFDNENSTILFKANKCELPFKSVEHYVVQALFEKSEETKMTEGYLRDYYCGFGGDGDETKYPTRIYDAVIRINRKVKSKLGIPKLISYKSNNYWLNKIPTE